MSIRLFVFGMGYAATTFARAMRGGAGWIGGSVSSVEAAVEMAGEGFRVSIFDGSAAGIGVGAAVRHATHLLASIPPASGGDPALEWHRASILAADHLTWIGYLSTVGVYGDHGGEWVTEATEPHPTTDRSVARLEAEHAWEAVARERGVPLAIFRLAGIYGPGRNAFVNLNEGKARQIVKPGQVFNRIHVDDIAATLKAAVARRASGAFNLADDEPSPPEDVVTFAADLMGVPPPPATSFDEADLSPMARSFYGENKRVANARIKTDLDVTLRYPTYREGLTEMWRENTWR